MAIAASASSSVLVETLPIIRRLVRRECSRRGMWSEADDLCSELAVKLLDHDCAALKQFDGRGDFHGFLARVVQRVVIDYGRRAWGKWRPRAAARKLGPTAVLLDRLVTRDRVPADEAIRITATTAGLPPREVEQIHRSLGHAPARRRLDPAPNFVPFCSAIEADERAEEVDMLRQALAAAIFELSSADRELIRKRYVENRTITEIADASAVDRKMLYRRFERIHATLRERLSQFGMDRLRVLRLLEDPIDREPLFS